MRNKLRIFVLICLLALLIGCATAGGALVGGGIGRIAGDEKAGAMIGAGVGMMMDIK